MEPVPAPTFTKQQKLRAAQKFKRWLLLKGMKANATRPLLGIGRAQKLYDFINHGVASRETIQKVLDLMGVSAASLAPTKRRGPVRVRRRKVRARAYPVVVYFTPQEFALLGRYITTLRAADEARPVKLTRTDYVRVGKPVVHQLAVRFRDAKQLATAAAHVAMQERFALRGGGSQRG